MKLRGQIEEKHYYFTLIGFNNTFRSIFSCVSITENQTRDQVSSYLNAREDAPLISSIELAYDWKMGRYMAEVLYEDELDVRYSYIYDKENKKVRVLNIIKSDQGMEGGVQKGKHDSLDNY
ncbi:hypothetical protein [Bacillus infantis]|uniref:hypothetical protein n=1 Tax=Bacillus infantis TaxID=324767 RepID=UPI003CF7DA05